MRFYFTCLQMTSPSLCEVHTRVFLFSVALRKERDTVKWCLSKASNIDEWHPTSIESTNTRHGGQRNVLRYLNSIQDHKFIFFNSLH
jgi:hypothetical protein